MDINSCGNLALVLPAKTLKFWDVLKPNKALWDRWRPCMG